MRVPGATYRIQLQPSFGFQDAREIAGYLWELGISDLYASPIFQARKGSLHGYSVTNPLEINPELGGRNGFDRLVRRLQSLEMGLLLDIVPNHMSTSHENPWWLDVLENGPDSPFAPFFDIDWHSPEPALKGRVLIPILGKPFGETLEAGELRLDWGEGGFSVRYYDHRFPVDPATWGAILSHRLEDWRERLGEKAPAVEGLMGVVALVEHLPARSTQKRAGLRDRIRRKETIKRDLRLLREGSGEVRAFLEENVRAFNGRKGDPGSFDLLERLLDAQPYRLADWRVSLETVNYRRFFSVNDLIGVRVEIPEVFQARHSLLFRLIREGKVSGLRIDHIDGLHDPEGYLPALQRAIHPTEGAANGADFYVVVEKILAEEESLPGQWPVSGTTGYDFLNRVNGLFVTERGFRELKRIYDRFTGTRWSLAKVVHRTKRLVMETLFGGEVKALAVQLKQLAAQDRHARDLPQEALVQVLVEVTACLEVYRTYMAADRTSEQDRVFLKRSLQDAARRKPSLSPGALEFLGRVLLPPAGFPSKGGRAEERTRFVARWQQFTGPVMAKGVEDTALYTYHPLVSLNEVGGSGAPLSKALFHRFHLERSERWPSAMNATSTHDTKRSEDVRSRIHVLSEWPSEWEARIRRWHLWNRDKRTFLQGSAVPDPNEEILLYQTLLGAWPLAEQEVPAFHHRLTDYVVKAARESKVHTRWISPHRAHEDALTAFVNAILDGSGENEFLTDFMEFQERVAYFGALNSLSQLLLKTASPGIPDFYQGTELWDFSLVDPDNRRPVDFETRRRLLADLQAGEREGRSPLIADLLTGWKDGRLKLYVTYKALHCRRAHPELFRRGAYLPLKAQGRRREHVVAFARKLEGKWAVVAVGRFLGRLTQPGRPPLGRAAWGTGSLLLPPEAPSLWLDALTGETLESIPAKEGRSVPLSMLFRHLPVSLLTGSMG